MEGFLGGVIGKIVAAVTGIAGIFGGLAATGTLPGVAGSNEPVEASGSTQASTPAGSSSVSASGSVQGVPTPAVPEVDPASAPQIQQAVTIAAQAKQTAASAQAAASQCVNAIAAEIIALIGSVAGVTDPAQAQQLVDKAVEIGAQARACADEARALAQQGVDQATAASGLMGNLPVVGTNPAGGPSAAGIATGQTAVDDANEIADDALAMALRIIEQVTEMATGAFNDALGIQQKAQAAGLKAAGSAAGLAPDSVPSVPGTDGLPSLPGLGDDGFPSIPGVGGANPGELGLGLAGEVLSTLTGAFGGGLPVPGGLPGLGG